MIGNAQGLAVNGDTCLLQDREGSLWIGLGGAGLARWLGYQRWESWTAAEGLSDSEIWAIARDASGTLWAGTEFGLNRFDAAARRWRPWPDKLAKTRIRAVVPAAGGHLWIGAWLGGVLRLDPLTGRLETFGTASGLASDRITSLLVDSRGVLWVATLSGLFRAPAAGGTLRFERVRPSGLKTNSFSRVMEEAPRLNTVQSSKKS